MWEWLEALEKHPGPFSGMVLCYNGPTSPSNGWKSCEMGIGKSPRDLFHLLWCQRIDPGTEELPRDRPCAPHRQLCSVPWFGDTLECPS